MSFEFLNISIGDEGVATVVMNRPPVNAVSLQMYREIYELFTRIDQLGDVRAVVLTGAGRHFCAGNDLDDFATMNEENVRERMFHVREAFFAVQECEAPVVGAVQGAALGTGVALAASCDFVVAADDIRLGLPELSVGVMGGARHLARLVPQPLVRWMFLTGQTLDAASLERLGAVVRVAPAADVVEAAREEAVRIAAYSPTAIRVGKRGLSDIEFLDIRRGYELEQGLTARMTRSPDCLAALHAALSGTTPVYQPYDPLI